MFGTSLNLTSHVGLSQPALALSSHRLFEVAALAPQAPQTGVLLLDTAVEVSLATQVGLLLAVPACFQLALVSGVYWLDLRNSLQPLHAQLQQMALIQLQEYRAVAPVFGTANQSLISTMDRWTWVLESADLWLSLGELWGVSWGVALVAGLGAHRLRSQVGYDDLITLCQQRGISVAEVLTLTTAALGLCAFDAFVTLAEDDVLEAVSYVFGCVIALAVLLLAVAVDVQYYYMISAISSGEASLRLLYADVVNNGLCLLRVFFCWIRYLFYDLQSELVDFAFHYTETSEEQALEALAGAFLVKAGEPGLGGAYLSALVGSGALVLLDAVAAVVQLLIGGFKLALALFLFWLILDLFLLRTAARAEALGLLQSRRHSTPRRSKK